MLHYMEKTVNDRIRVLRNTLKLTQTEFAGRINMSTPGLWKIENNDSTPRKNTIKRISEEFNASFEWLNDGIGEMMLDGDSYVDVSTSSKSNSWKDEAYNAVQSKVEHLEKEVLFYRQLLTNLTGKAAGNFKDAFFLAGILEGNIEESVRAAA